MAKDGKVAGIIGGGISPPPVMTEAANRQKLEEFRRGRLVVADALFDGEHGQFLIKGKHPTLIGQEPVLAIDVSVLLLLLVPVIPNYLVPVLTGQIKLEAPKVG